MSAKTDNSDENHYGVVKNSPAPITLPDPGCLVFHRPEKGSRSTFTVFRRIMRGGRGGGGELFLPKKDDNLFSASSISLTNPITGLKSLRLPNPFFVGF